MKGKGGKGVSGAGMAKAGNFSSKKGPTKIPGLGKDNGLHHAIKTSNGKGPKGKFRTIESK